MLKINIQTPRWAVPLLAPSRYKGAKGGRSCVHPDTLIDTPSGQVKIKDFGGGHVYSCFNGVIVEAEAERPVELTCELLTEVVLDDGRSIIATDNHRFLTQRGWVELRHLSTSDAFVCEHSQEISAHSQTNSGSDPSVLHGDARHSKRTVLDYLDYYSLYRRRCDQLPPWEGDSDQSLIPLQGGGQRRSSRALFHWGGLALFCRGSLSLFLRHLSNLTSHPYVSAQSCGASENYIAGKSFGSLSATCRLPWRSRRKTAHTWRDLKPLKQFLDFSTYSDPAKSLRIVSRKQQPCVRDIYQSYRSCPSVSFKVVNQRTILNKVRLIRKHSRRRYWDLHVPVFNNYLSNGIVNHNSGKSHFFAERLVEHCVADPEMSVVCIREVQKSLKFSAKRLIEIKIRSMGVQSLFDSTTTEIRRVGGSGVIIFQGMQDHTADSIKSLEGFGIAWCEEAQNLSARSLELLLPTIRTENSEIWFSWNPDQSDDPVDNFLVANFPEGDAIVVHVNFAQNPFCPQVVKDEAARHLARDPEGYDHVWLGAYNTKADDQVLAGRWGVDEFEPADNWDGPYLGGDWGFAADPNTLMEVWVHENTLYVYREEYDNGVEIDDTPAFYDRNPNAKNHVVRADNARPEIISYMRRHGYPLVEAVDKWPGSVEDGISKLRSFDKIVIHPDCPYAIDEARLWKYKRDRLTGDILPKLIDAHDHCWDAVRYAIAPMIKVNSMGQLLDMAMGAD